MTDLAALERLVLATPANVQGELPIRSFGVDDLTGMAADVAPDLVEPENMSEAAFLEMWAQMHDVAGGMLQARIGASVPLGDQARAEGGAMAGKAVYAICLSNPALARLILSTKSTFFGQLAVIGLHGAACVQIVKHAANAGRNVDTSAPVFTSTRVDGDT